MVISRVARSDRTELREKSLPGLSEEPVFRVGGFGRYEKDSVRTDVASQIILGYVIDYNPSISLGVRRVSQKLVPTELVGLIPDEL